MKYRIREYNPLSESKYLVISEDIETFKKATKLIRRMIKQTAYAEVSEIYIDAVTEKGIRTVAHFHVDRRDNGPMKFGKGSI